MKTFEEIYQLREDDWIKKNWNRVKSQPTVAGKIGKFFANFLFDGDNWDDLSDSMIEYMNKPGLSKAEKMRRINQISSIFRKFDGRGDMYSQEEINKANKD